MDITLIEWSDKSVVAFFTDLVSMLKVNTVEDVASTIRYLAYYDKMFEKLFDELRKLSPIKPNP